MAYNFIKNQYQSLKKMLAQVSNGNNLINQQKVVHKDNNLNQLNKNVYMFGVTIQLEKINKIGNYNN